MAEKLAADDDLLSECCLGVIKDGHCWSCKEPVDTSHGGYGGVVIIGSMGYWTRMRAYSPRKTP